MKPKILAVAGVVVILVIAFIVGANMYRDHQAEQLGFLAQENAELFVPDYAPVQGNEAAKVYLVEFLDPECEACRAFYPLVKKIMADYEQDLKLVVRYAPFHRNSKNAVRVLEAARKQGKYWETLEIMFASQPVWADHHNPHPERLWEIIPEVGVDVEQIKADMNDPEIEQRMEQDIADGEKLGVSSTPTFFVNGTPLQKFGPDELIALVEAEIKKANQQP